ncbi:hypothetical protein HJG60_007988 [Phyllostomus discolor]|uniref:Uncharacterized protein n=1 Tax=Phyllostomus discolor TaxID=89673 RepID=A0A834BIS2_9CHIR|nr:hypothetical protein HJG60_007988 [Phyllostomus discolor]
MELIYSVLRKHLILKIKKEKSKIFSLFCTQYTFKRSFNCFITRHFRKWVSNCVLLNTGGSLGHLRSKSLRCVPPLLLTHNWTPTSVLPSNTCTHLAQIFVSAGRKENALQWLLQWGPRDTPSRSHSYP